MEVAGRSVLFSGVFVKACAERKKFAKILEKTTKFCVFSKISGFLCTTFAKIGFAMINTKNLDGDNE